MSSRESAARLGSRRARALGGWVVLVAGIVAVVAWRADVAPAQPEPDAEVDMALGGELYSAWCVHCHGSAGEGIVGEGVEAGPPVNDIDVQYVDLTIRTGRMPIVEPRVGIIQDPGFGDHERASLVAWMAEAFDLPGEIPVVSPGSPSDGAALYAMHCAACHGGGGVGGVSGGGATVREVKGLDEVAIVEAIRVGPFAMPRFSEEHISDEDAADIAAFVSEMSDDRRSPLGFREINRATAGGLLVPLLIAVMAIVMVASHAGTKRGR